MRKSTINKTWLIGLSVSVLGVVASLTGVFLMLAYGGTFAGVPGTNSYHFVASMDGSFWATIWVIAIGGIVALAGGIVQLVAWVEALISSYPLLDKVWFVVLLVGGLLSLAFAPIGFAVMLAYVIAGPDPSRSPLAPPPPPTAPIGPMAPTS